MREMRLLKDLYATIRALDDSLASEFQFASTVGASATLHARSGGGIEHALIPVDIAGEELLTYQVVDIALQCLTGHIEFKSGLAQRYLSLRLDHVQESFLFLNLGYVASFVATLENQKNTSKSNGLVAPFYVPPGGSQLDESRRFLDSHVKTKPSVVRP